MSRDLRAPAATRREDHVGGETTVMGESVKGSGSSFALSTFLSRYALVIATVVLFVFYSFLLPDTFPTMRNVQSMIGSQSAIVLLAIGSTLTLRNGDFDLSVAGNAIFAGSFLGYLVVRHDVLPPVLAIALVLLSGLVIGAINGVLVVVYELDALVVTLGMFTLLSGLSLAAAGGGSLTGFPEGLITVSTFRFLGLPAVAWYGFVAVVAAYYVYEHTPLGRYMYFIGGNRVATRLAGVNVARIRIGTYLVSGLGGSVAGILLVGLTGGIDPTSGGQYLLQPFAAAFLGATAFTVGRVNAFGTLAALYFLVVGITGIQMYGVSGWVTDFFNGTALVLAIFAAGFAERRRRNNRGSRG